MSSSQQNNAPGGTGAGGNNGPPPPPPQTPQPAVQGSGATTGSVTQTNNPPAPPVNAPRAGQPINVVPLTTEGDGFGSSRGRGGGGYRGPRGDRGGPFFGRGGGNRGGSLFHAGNQAQHTRFAPYGPRPRPALQQQQQQQHQQQQFRGSQRGHHGAQNPRGGNPPGPAPSLLPPAPPPQAASTMSAADKIWLEEQVGHDDRKTPEQNFAYFKKKAERKRIEKEKEETKKKNAAKKAAQEEKNAAKKAAKESKAPPAQHAPTARELELLAELDAIRANEAERARHEEEARKAAEAAEAEKKQDAKNRAMIALAVEEYKKTTEATAQAAPSTPAVDQNLRERYQAEMRATRDGWMRELETQHTRFVDMQTELTRHRTPMSEIDRGSLAATFAGVTNQLWAAARAITAQFNQAVQFADQSLVATETTVNQMRALGDIQMAHIEMVVAAAEQEKKRWLETEARLKVEQEKKEKLAKEEVEKKERLAREEEEKKERRAREEEHYSQMRAGQAQEQYQQGPMFPNMPFRPSTQGRFLQNAPQQEMGQQQITQPQIPPMIINNNLPQPPQQMTFQDLGEMPLYIASNQMAQGGFNNQDPRFRHGYTTAFEDTRQLFANQVLGNQAFGNRSFGNQGQQGQRQSIPGPSGRGLLMDPRQQGNGQQQQQQQQQQGQQGQQEQPDTDRQFEDVDIEMGGLPPPVVEKPQD
ncbi:MAG: hypothetical protein Q9221_005272 [Calogaya cf. arnoldii]